MERAWAAIACRVSLGSSTALAGPTQKSTQTGPPDGWTAFIANVCSFRTRIANLDIRSFPALRVKAFLGGDVLFSAVLFGEFR